jgi:hypothetical protein
METDRPGLAAKMIRLEMNVIEAQTRELRAKLSRAIAEEAREKGQS